MNTVSLSKYLSEKGRFRIYFGYDKNEEGIDIIYYNSKRFVLAIDIINKIYRCRIYKKRRVQFFSKDSTFIRERMGVQLLIIEQGSFKDLPDFEDFLVTLPDTMFNQHTQKFR